MRQADVVLDAFRNAERASAAPRNALIVGTHRIVNILGKDLLIPKSLTPAEAMGKCAEIRRDGA
jgi:hypothetical protein